MYICLSGTLCRIVSLNYFDEHWTKSVPSKQTYRKFNHLRLIILAEVLYLLYKIKLDWVSNHISMNICLSGIRCKIVSLTLYGNKGWTKSVPSRSTYREIFIICVTQFCLKCQWFLLHYIKLYWISNRISMNMSVRHAFLRKKSFIILLF